jgi:hypothetical protein
MIVASLLIVLFIGAMLTFEQKTYSFLSEVGSLAYMILGHFIPGLLYLATQRFRSLLRGCLAVGLLAVTVPITVYFFYRDLSSLREEGII